ncbi:MAG TPA: hypothetical protein PKA81_00840 [Clostridia bacterium]|nr:hypothetical protein [Clostridia bacterium]
MRTGQSDDYIQKLNSIVEVRNKEIAQKLGKEDFLSGRRIQLADVEEIPTEPANALSIIQLNLNNMHDYFEWSLTQAKIIFGVAAGSCIVGIVLIVLSFVFAVLGKFALDQAILTAIGGVATELFAGTTLIVYRSSLKQLNFYHKSLHEDQRFLSSVDLLCRFSNDKNRDKMLQTIICSSMQISIAAAAEDDGTAEQEAPKP